MAQPTFSLFSSEARRDPHPHYAALRRHAPVHFFPEMGVWTVSRYADVMTVFKRPDVFSSAGAASFESTLLGSDPPAHTRIRKIVTPFFTGKRIATLEGQIQAHTDRLIDEIIRRGRLELVGDLSGPLPLLVIAELLGIDTARCEDFKNWSTAIVLGASGMLPPSEMAQTKRSMDACHAFFEAHLARCQRGQADGILADFLGAGPDGEAVTPKEAVELGKLLLVAGNETTTNLIGNAMVALLRNPEILEAVRGNLDLIPALIEEVVRYDSPAQMVQRVTTQDVEIGGVTIPTGSRVLVLIGSANRDEAEFPEADRLVLDRDGQTNVAFGFGVHYCLGSHIARLEGRIVLSALLSRLPDLRAAQPLERVEWIQSFHVRGPERLELAFGPESERERAAMAQTRSPGLLARLLQRFTS